jgi:hypothetical protein
MTYDIYMGTDGNLEIISSNQVNLQYNTQNLDYHTTYFWQIVANSTLLHTTGPVWQFETRYLNYPPYEPENPEPETGETGISSTIALNWDCTDPENNEINFDLYLGTEEAPPLFAENIPFSQYDPGLLESFTTYYWRVRAWDSDNYTDGVIWYFTTGQQNMPPDQPYMPWPADGAADESIYGILRWSCHDQEDDPLFFNIYWGTSSELTEDNLIEEGIEDMSWEVGTLDYLTTYYWMITVTDGDATTIGAVWNFTTEDERK